jgi:2-aminoadipate transaminase
MSPHPAPSPALFSDPDGYPLAEWTRELRPSTIQAMLGHMARPGVISFALGLPAPELFPLDDFAAAATRVLRDDPGALQYRAPYAPLKEQVAALMRQRGVPCAPAEVFLTSGAQQALSLLARLLLEPGGTVICERLVYMGFQQVLEPFAPRILAVDSDLETGIEVDQVEALLAAGERPAFIYCITDGHNPLGVSISLEKRLRLVELARRYRVPLVEDDAYGLLHYEQPRPPLRALEADWVCYVGSFSKVMAPGFRAGWAVVPAAQVSLLGCAKDGADIDTGTFSQRLVSEYLATGEFDAHLRRVRAAYRARRAAMLQALERHFPAGTRWSLPRHGALVWAELPPGYDTAALLPGALAEHDVAYVPGSAFALPGGDGRRGVRLNFSYPSVAQIEEGMRRLGVLFAAGGARAAA